jgi:phenylpropionate dioxygenase-like ring-hydroxylating dioxygenase large terminal subunit
MVDRGTSKLLNCPYHAWSFRPDGTLSTVPHPQSYPESFNLDDPVNHMQRVPNVARYRGFIFASLAEAPPPLLDQLGAMTEIIDNLVDRAPEGEVEVSETAFVIEYRGNWKLHIENAADIFHPSFVHSSSVGAARRAPQTPSRLDSEQTRTMLEGNAFGVKQWEGLQLVGLPGGHTYMSSFYSKGVLVDQDDDPVMLEYKRRMVAAWGREKTEATLGVDRFNNIIYPNMVLNAGHQQMRVTLPLSHGRTQVRVQCFRLKGAPDEMYHRAVRFLSTIASPASMIFSDDVEMLERCQVGLERDDSPWLDFSRGFGADTSVTAERISTVASEMPMRVQFRAWVDYMTREGA